jgi:aerobic-type carbon monoxide dehydrogenase small subunit (CoxS/CutS family)
VTRFRIRVNGTPRTVDAPDDMPLLWVLRDRLGLTGPRYGCGRGYCGACVVHLDGRATPSCALPIGVVRDAEITTIEGLGAVELHAVQRAWIIERVPQCGYCQAGQVMSAAALLARNPDPDDADVAEAMRGNLCRCGTYGRIRRAIQRAAALLRREAP